MPDAAPKRGQTAFKEADERPMSSGMDPAVKTYRGRTLDELLPKIRAELGPDAIVLRRREGLAGGVGGFFQKSFVEVEARGPVPSDSDVETRNDRATAEGLRSPAIQALVEQAAPFADALARAESTASDRAADVLMAAAVADPARGLYGPQPRYTAPETPSTPVATAPAEVALVTPPPPAGPGRPGAADAAERRMVAAGVSAGLAADIAGEAAAHGLPFGMPKQFKKLARAALARRIPVLCDLGPDRRVIAVAGAGGAGKTALVAQLAAAYAAADHEVVAVALQTRDGGCALAATLEPLGVSVVAASDAGQASRRLRRREALVTLIDTPALGSGDARAAAALAPELRALGATEVHLALPATVSAA